MTVSTSAVPTRHRLAPRWPFSAPARSQTLQPWSSGLSMGSISSGLKMRWDSPLLLLTIKGGTYPHKKNSAFRRMKRSGTKSFSNIGHLGITLWRRGLTPLTPVYYYSQSVSRPRLAGTLRHDNNTPLLRTCWSECFNQIVNNRLLSARAAGEQQV